MTLLVAAIEDGRVWMVSDTAVTSQTADHRHRQESIKIFPFGNSSLIGFADDMQAANEVILKATATSPGEETLQLLLQENRYFLGEGIRNVDFAYAVMASGVPRLFKIADGIIQEVKALYLGSHPAFEKFQRIRHEGVWDYPPNSYLTFLCGGAARDPFPESIDHVIRAMGSLFVSSSDRTVGGIAVPYVLSPHGVEFVSYAVNVTDCIADQLQTGNPIPFDTPEGRGFSMSVTELAEHGGVAVYWLQKHGGAVFVRNPGNYDRFEIAGDPEDFRHECHTRFGKEAPTWFGSGESQPIKAIGSQPDQADRFNFWTSSPKSSFSLDWIPEGEPYAGNVLMEYRTPDSSNEIAIDPSTCRIVSAKLSDDARLARIDIVIGQETSSIEVDAKHLDRLIAELGRVRATMLEAVEGGFLGPHKKERAIARPAFHAEEANLPGLSGVALALRHPGLGWISFVLRTDQVLALAKFLANTQTPGDA